MYTHTDIIQHYKSLRVDILRARFVYFIIIFNVPIIRCNLLNIIKLGLSN